MAPITTPSFGRRLVLAAALTAVVGALIAGPAAADPVAPFLGRAPLTSAEADRLEVVYQGRSYTWMQIDRLEKQGRPLVSVYAADFYNRGQVYAFDTGTEADQWACVNIAGLAARPGCNPG